MHTVLALSAWSVPAAFALAALSPTDPAARVALATRWALAAAAVVAVGGALAPGVALGAHLDAVTAIVLPLVALLAFVVARFSRSYLAGDPTHDAYFRRLGATLAAVTTLVVTDDLVVLALAWVATSLALHGLLAHTGRPGARLAAREKFAVSRAAEVLVLGAVGLVAGTLETTSIAGIAASVPDPLPGTLQLAALGVAGCVVLKTAQLPFHGWITRVMEAPTPVSALLHAGVVNVGGLVLVRLAPLMAHAEAAQAALVAVGTVTAVVGGLVSATRPTVKSALAWSTIAQMGFLLVQCGLGAYALALLHLVAHSAYKAHAFLAAGSAVDRHRLARLASASPPGGPGAWLAGALVALAATAALAGITGSGADPAALAVGWVLALAVAPLLATGTSAGALAAFGALAGAFGWHAAFHALVPVVDAAPSAGRVALVVAGATAGFLVHAALATRPRGRLATALHPALAAGLWLDLPLTRAAGAPRPAPEI